MFVMTDHAASLRISRRVNCARFAPRHRARPAAPASRGATSSNASSPAALRLRWKNQPPLIPNASEMRVAYRLTVSPSGVPWKSHHSVQTDWPALTRTRRRAPYQTKPRSLSEAQSTVYSSPGSSSQTSGSAHARIASASAAASPHATENWLPWPRSGLTKHGYAAAPASYTAGHRTPRGAKRSYVRRVERVTRHVSSDGADSAQPSESRRAARYGIASS